MRALREDERDEIESVAHFVKYVLSKPNVEDWEVFGAVMKINEIGQKYVISQIVTEEELGELTDLDDMKEVVTKLLIRIDSHIARKLNE